MNCIGLWLTVGGKEEFFPVEQISSADVDSENTFTPLCMGELPVPGGNEVVDEENENAKYAKFRVGSKDAHSMASLWVDTDKEPQFTAIKGYSNLDIRWRVHGVPGTFGFELIAGLPHVTGYDYFIWKGIELDMHPYGICYHDLHNKLSTGLIEWAYYNGIKVFIVGGLATDYCVKDSVLQLLKAKFVVILNLAACRAINESSYADALIEMKREGKKQGDTLIIINDSSDLKNMSEAEEGDEE